MAAKCRLESRDAGSWCLDHRIWHNGALAAIATGDTDRDATIRDQWDTFYGRAAWDSATRGPCRFARRPILRLAVLRCDHPTAGPLATWDSCRACPHYEEASSATSGNA